MNEQAKAACFVVAVVLALSLLVGEAFANPDRFDSQEDLRAALALTERLTEEDEGGDACSERLAAMFALASEGLTETVDTFPHFLKHERDICFKLQGKPISDDEDLDMCMETVIFLTTLCGCDDSDYDTWRPCVENEGRVLKAIQEQVVKANLITSPWQVTLYTLKYPTQYVYLRGLTIPSTKGPKTEIL